MCDWQAESYSLALIASPAGRTQNQRSRVGKCPKADAQRPEAPRRRGPSELGRNGTTWAVRRHLTVGLVSYTGDGVGESGWGGSSLSGWRRRWKGQPGLCLSLSSFPRGPHCPSVKLWMPQTRQCLELAGIQSHRTQGPAQLFPPEPLATVELPPPARWAQVNREAEQLERKCCNGRLERGHLLQEAL